MKMKQEWLSLAEERTSSIKGGGGLWGIGTA